MRIKNLEVEMFFNFLMQFELKGRDSRLRTRFAKLLMERQKLVSEEHNELIKQFSNKDENGYPKVIEMEDGNKKYDVEDVAGFNREYHMLLNEDFVIEENEEREELLIFIKNLVLNCDHSFSGEKALEYDRWCEIVEEISYGE